MWSKMMKEVKLGRHAGPFRTIPYDNYMQSPIGLVPKAGNQMRLIFHLSYNFGPNEKSLNFHTPEELCRVSYWDLDYAVETCLYALGKCGKFLGRTINLSFSKSDLKSAFCLMPILPSQHFLLIMYAHHPISNEVRFFVDKNLPFRASISCRRFQDFSDALKHLVEHILGEEMICTNYLDDFLFTSVNRQVCDHMLTTFLELCEWIGCPVSHDKTEWSSDRIVFPGILLDGKSLSLAIPIEKKNKTMHLLNWVCQSKKVTIRIVQKLTGTLNFLMRVIVPERTFTRRM